MAVGNAAGSILTQTRYYGKVKTFNSKQMRRKLRRSASWKKDASAIMAARIYDIFGTTGRSSQCWVKFWNAPASDLKAVSDMTLLKAKLKTFLFSQAYNENLRVY